jgi:hypothetical protein
MKIGTTQEQRKEAAPENPLEDTYELVEGSNLFRFFQGPKKINVIFIPTLREKDNKLEPSFLVLKFKDTCGIIDAMYQLEQSVRNALGEEKPEYALKPQEQWWYLALRLNAPKNDGKIRPLKVAKGTKDDINGLESALAVEDQNYLRNGLYYMYNILIEKTVNPAKPKKFGTSYTTSIYGTNPYMGLVPSEWLTKGFDEVISAVGDGDFNNGLKEVFTEEMIASMESCDYDLDDMLKPMEESKINELLFNATINIGYVNPLTGKHKFPQSPKFIQGLRELGLKLMDFSSTDDSDVKKSTNFKKSADVAPKEPEAEPVPAVKDPEPKQEAAPKEETPAAETKTTAGGLKSKIGGGLKVPAKNAEGKSSLGKKW